MNAFKKLENERVELQKELNKLLMDQSPLDKNVLKKSQELDAVICKIYKLSQRSSIYNISQERGFVEMDW